MWKILHACCQGTSHQKSGQPCQDYARAVEVLAQGETVLLAVCADGAGSAEFSQLGSRLACETITRLATAALESGLKLDQFGRDHIMSWHSTAVLELEAAAHAHGAPLREFACTLLLALVGQERAIFSQIGDGAIVAAHDSEYESIFWPQSGEYANTTNFLTDSQYAQRLEVSIREGKLDDIAIFTDGLQPLVLDYAARKPHTPFFAPLFGTVRGSQASNDLFAPLQRFLDSARVNERTDDDKTLIVATRHPADATPQSL